MTQVTVELKTNSVNAPVEIKQGQYVEIGEYIYVCARVDENSLNLIRLCNGNRWKEPQKGDTYMLDKRTPIRFIDKIKITEE